MQVGEQRVKSYRLAGLRELINIAAISSMMGMPKRLRYITSFLMKTDMKID